ncbi:MAG: hypothetical protein EOM87_04190 [Clostridia bacterium]|nr:hypothetical protein [Clostridia bacterium]
MKKIMLICLLLVLLAISICLTACKKKALDPIESGDYYYCLENEKACIIGLSKSGREQTELTIPSHIDGYMVKSLGRDEAIVNGEDNHFVHKESSLGKPKVKRIIVPEYIVYVYWNRFVPITSIERIVVQNANARIYGHHISNLENKFVIPISNNYKEWTFLNFRKYKAVFCLNPIRANVIFDLNYKLPEETNNILYNLAVIRAQEEIFIKSEEAFLEQKALVNHYVDLMYEWDTYALEDKKILIAKYLLVSLGATEEEVNQITDESYIEQIDMLLQYSDIQDFWEDVLNKLPEYDTRTYEEYLEECQGKIENRTNSLLSTLNDNLRAPNLGNYWIDYLYEGEAITKPITDPVREISDKAADNYPTVFEGYHFEFDGWYLDSACTESADFDNIVMGSELIRFYAKWVFLAD